MEFTSDAFRDHAKKLIDDDNYMVFSTLLQYYIIKNEGICLADEIDWCFKYLVGGKLIVDEQGCWWKTHNALEICLLLNYHVIMKDIPVSGEFKHVMNKLNICEVKQRS